MRTFFYRQIHLHFGVIGYHATRNHGIQLTVSVMTLFFLMIEFSYDIYFLWLSTSVPSEIKLQKACILFVWILTQTYGFIYMNHVCDATVTQVIFIVLKI